MKIHLWIGTKAELIKMVGVIKELDRRKIPYNYVHTGQHTNDSVILSSIFNIRKPDTYIAPLKRNLLNPKEMFFWFFRVLKNSLNYSEIRKGDIVIVHGDTESALLGMLVAKMKGAKLMHVEGGLRTGHLVNPFPEEIIRRLVDRSSSHLFVPGKTAEKNVLNFKPKEKVTNTLFNTGWDSLILSLNIKPTISIPKGKYAVLM
ncbi:MAG: UDP-N-acetylglucosamine 2-epimerase, partial [Nanoarchaeota archaeon]|nr:UDP-N-acetylglucosamine 2-epimerase [Nanoarchaeota archaeon]